MSELTCPKCNNAEDVSRSRRRWGDGLMRAMGLKAVRCRRCGRRFWVHRGVPVKRRTPVRTNLDSA